MPKSGGKRKCRGGNAATAEGIDKGQAALISKVAPSSIGVAASTTGKRYGSKATETTTACSASVPHTTKPSHKMRKPRPPPFTELFIKAKENNDSDSLESSTFFKEASHQELVPGRAPLVPLLAASLNSDSGSLCVPDDTFDKIFSKKIRPSTIQLRSAGTSGVEDSCSTSDTASLDLPGPLYVSLDSRGPSSFNFSTDLSGPWCIPPSPPYAKPQKFPYCHIASKGTTANTKICPQQGKIIEPSKRQKDSVIDDVNNPPRNSISTVKDTENISQDSLLDIDARKSSQSSPSGSQSKFFFKTPTLVSHRTRNRSKCLGKLSRRSKRPSQEPSTSIQHRRATLTNACLSGKLATVRTRRRLTAQSHSRHKQDELLVEFSMSGDKCRVLSVSQMDGKRWEFPSDNDDTTTLDVVQSGLVTQRQQPGHVIQGCVGSDVFKYPMLPDIHLKPQGRGVPCNNMLSTVSSGDFCVVSKCSDPRDRLTSTPSERPRGNLRQFLPSSSTPATVTDNVSHLDKLSPVRSDDHSQHIRIRSSTLFESPMLEHCQQDDVFKENKPIDSKQVESPINAKQNAEFKDKNRLRFSEDSSGDPSSSYNTASSTKWKSPNQIESPVNIHSSTHKCEDGNTPIQSIFSPEIIDQLSRPCSVVLTDCINTNSEPRLSSDLKSFALTNNTNGRDEEAPRIHKSPCKMSITIKTTKSNKHAISELQAFIHPRTTSVSKSPDCGGQPRMSGPTTSMLQSSFFREAMCCAFAPSPVFTRRRERNRASQLMPNVDELDTSWGSEIAYKGKQMRRRNIRSILTVDGFPVIDLSVKTGPATEQRAVAGPTTEQSIVGEPVRTRSGLSGSRPRSPAISSRKSRRTTRHGYSAARRMLTRSQLRRQRGSYVNASNTNPSVSNDSNIESVTSIMSVDESNIGRSVLQDTNSRSAPELESSIQKLSLCSETDSAVCVIKNAGVALGTSLCSELPSIMELSVQSGHDEHGNADSDKGSVRYSPRYKSSCSINSVTSDVIDQSYNLQQGGKDGKHNDSDSSVDDLERAEAVDAFAMPAIIDLPTKRGKGWRRSLSSFGVSAVNCSRTSLASFRSRVPGDGDRRQTAPGSISFKLGTSTLSANADGGRNSTLDWRRRSSVLQRSVVVASSHGREDLELDARRQVLDLCGQDDELPITDCFSDREGCRKIGEGVYGEVFMVPAEGTMPAKVLKVMPIEGHQEVNGEPQKTFSEILSEIIISIELSGLRNGSHHRCSNFVHVLRCWCVYGAYTDHMLRCWDNFHEEKGSENDRPDLFGPKQLYIVLEFGHAGKDLECYFFNNASQALSVFWQVAHGLSVAESKLEFEHRDLHWGNVLVASTPDTSELYRLEDKESVVGLQGVRATIIDFTLSRLRCSPSLVVYNNLAADPSLFTATGDYQFDVYRAMKDANGNEWEKFEPRTNCLWLHYLVDKLISECYYKNIKTKVHRTNLTKLKRLRDSILQYNSARQLVMEGWQEHG